MNRPWYQQIASILTGTLQTTLRRFPVTVLFGIALSVYLIHLIATDYETENKLIVIIGYYLSAGTLLSLTLHLWSEEMEHPVRKAIAHVLPHGLLIADALFLYSLSPGESLTEIGIAHGAAIFAIGISVFFFTTCYGTVMPMVRFIFFPSLRPNMRVRLSANAVAVLVSYLAAGTGLFDCIFLAFACLFV